MFKRPIRIEPVCLNCGTETTRRFCPQCGQENVAPKLPIGDLIKEMIKQIVDVDGKFYKTMRHLFARPGIVAKEFTSGKRKTYTHPVRLFFLFGAIFLLCFNLHVDVDTTARHEAEVQALQKGIDPSSEAFKPLLKANQRTYGSLFGSLVYVIILSIPLFAFLSKIFLRSKRKYYYVDYLIYAMYNYIVYFIPLSLILIGYYLLDPHDPKANRWGLIAFLFIVLSHGSAAAKKFFEYNIAKSVFAGIFQLIFLIIAVVLAIIVVMMCLFMMNFLPANSTFNVS